MNLIELMLLSVGSFLIAYMLKIEVMNVVDRPLIWGSEVVRTVVFFVGVLLIILAKFFM